PRPTANTLFPYTTLFRSVFHNRIKEGMYLQSCATVQYILGERKEVLSTADTLIPSPYNTYINEGLPPGPIASPGEASIIAAVNRSEEHTSELQSRENLVC